MVLPKVLSPSFWVDKCLTLVLQLVLALLLQILYILKGEDVRVTDVKVTVRKAIPSDRKSIIQSPAKATRPARQNITVKPGPNAAPGESTREIKAPIIASKEPSEEQIITGTLTELKPDKIEKIEAKAEISTSTATPIIETETVTFEVEKSEDIVEVKAEEPVEVRAEEIEPEIKADEPEVSEIISEIVEGSQFVYEPVKVIPELKPDETEVSEIISEMVNLEPKADEPEVSEIISEIVDGSQFVYEPVKVIPELKPDETEVSEIISEMVILEPKADEPEVSEIISEVVEGSQFVYEPVKVIPELNADETEVSEIISEMVILEPKADESQVSEAISEVVKGSELPPEMKTSHEITHSDSHIETVEFRWNDGGNKVFVTGDFDGWSGVTHEMQPDYTNGGFVLFMPIDRTKKQEFKFVVDKNWRVNTHLDTKSDEHGNVNNVIYALDSDQLSHEYKEFEISTSYQLAAAY